MCACVCVSVCVCLCARAEASCETAHRFLETERNIIISFLVAQLCSTAPGASTHKGHS